MRLYIGYGLVAIYPDKIIREPPSPWNDSSASRNDVNASGVKHITDGITGYSELLILLRYTSSSKIKGERSMGTTGVLLNSGREFQKFLRSPCRLPLITYAEAGGNPFL